MSFPDPGLTPVPDKSTVLAVRFPEPVAAEVTEAFTADCQLLPTKDTHKLIPGYFLVRRSPGDHLRVSI